MFKNFLIPLILITLLFLLLNLKPKPNNSQIRTNGLELQSAYLVDKNKNNNIIGVMAMNPDSEYATISDNFENFNNINNIDKSNSTNELNNNFKMGNKSIIRSMTTHLSKEDCFNKFSKSDINGVSFNNKTNECISYFFAEKGDPDLNFESYIYTD